MTAFQSGHTEGWLWLGREPSFVTQCLQSVCSCTVNLMVVTGMDMFPSGSKLTLVNLISVNSQTLWTQGDGSVAV